MVYIVLAKRGYFWCIMGALRDSSAPIPPTMHYTLPRFILKDPGLQLLGIPQKQGVVWDVMINPKITLGLTRGE